MVHYIKDQIVTSITTPVHFIAHHWFTKIFRALFEFLQTAAFHYKKFVFLHRHKKDEENDVQMGNRKLIFKNLDDVQLEFQVRLLRLASEVHSAVQCCGVDNWTLLNRVGLIITFDLVQ